MVQKIEDTLAERGSNYGDFYTQAKIAQTLKDVMKATPNWGALPDDMKECLSMVAHKISRILNGDPFFHDSWHDIIGYVKLVADRILEGKSKPAPEPMIVPQEPLIFPAQVIDDE
jgi:hypothetical protein